MDKISKTETFSWTMGFVGTGIGAGILFLPIQAGTSGMICFLLSCCIAFTLSYVSHKTFAKLIIDSGAPKDFPQVIQNYLGNTFALITTILFFLLMIGYLSVYVIGLNVGLSEYLYSLKIIQTPLHNTSLFPLILISTLVAIISLNERIIIKIMSFITFPLIILLLILSLSLIQHWHLSYFTNIPSPHKFIAGMFYNLPILIFAGLFFPPITSMVLSHRKTLGKKIDVQKHSYKTIKYAQIVLLGFTIFFTISCLLATPPEILSKSVGSNLNIMAILGKTYKTKSLSIIAPLIAVIAIITSFLGYYFGAKESIKNLIAFFLKRYKEIPENNMNSILNTKRMTLSINISLGIFLWVIAMLNFGIERFLSVTCTPITAFLLYIIPVIIFTRISMYKRYRSFAYYTLIAGAVILLSSVWIADIITDLFC
jgi:serine transporter